MCLTSELRTEKLLAQYTVGMVYSEQDGSHARHPRMPWIAPHRAGDNDSSLPNRAAVACCCAGTTQIVVFVCLEGLSSKENCDSPPRTQAAQSDASTCCTNTVPVHRNTSKETADGVVILLTDPWIWHPFALCSGRRA